MSIHGWNRGLNWHTMSSLVFQYALPLPILLMLCQLAESTLSMPYIIPLLSRNPQDLGHLAWQGRAHFIEVDVQSKLDVTHRLTLPTNISLLEPIKIKLLHKDAHVSLITYIYSFIGLFNMWKLKGRTHTLIVICSVKEGGSTLLLMRFGDVH